MPSSTETRWVPAPEPDTGWDALLEAGFTPWSARLLARRGVHDRESARAFLRPSLDDLHDPGDLAGMAEATERLLAAAQRGEPVAVVGDYDVDGVTGTALLTVVLRACGLEVRPILPHRLKDGYGFQPIHVERARAAGCGVVVTVDCGTSSHDAAEAALAAGLDVVVTDHHLPGDPLPDGVILVNPKREDCSYPFDELSGAGLAFKLALAVAAAKGREIDPLALLRVACLGTIADLVPLRGENRVIASLGLGDLPRTPSAGLRALFEVARLRPPFTAYDVGFRLGPRLNAPGRLDSADQALELLLCRDPQRARQLAEELDRFNRERREHEHRAADQAREKILERGELPPILVAWDSRWHRGVVGIAAGRLAREFNRPTILLAVEGAMATGSGRSIEGLHLHGFLSDWRDQLERFGGHSQAIGLTAEVDKLESLRATWEEAAEPWQERVSVRTLEYELDLTPGELDPQFVRGLFRLAPHGNGNRRPLIRLRGPLKLATPPRFFGKGHVSGRAEAPDGARIRFVAWGWQEKASAFEGEFELLGHLEPDRYLGGSVLRLVDCRPATEAMGEPLDG